MAEIQDLQLECQGWWSPRLPSLLSGQGGAAFGEVYKIMFIKKKFYLYQAYGKDNVRGSFLLRLPTVTFMCHFSYNYECGAHFHYETAGSDVKNYRLIPKPVAFSHGTTATVIINIVDPQ